MNICITYLCFLHASLFSLHSSSQIHFIQFTFIFKNTLYSVYIHLHKYILFSLHSSLQIHFIQFTLIFTNILHSVYIHLHKYTLFSLHSSLQIHFIQFTFNVMHYWVLSDNVVYRTDCICIEQNQNSSPSTE